MQSEQQQSVLVIFTTHINQNSSVSKVWFKKSKEKDMLNIYSEKIYTKFFF